MKALISGSLDLEGLRCGSTFTLCHSLSKKAFYTIKSVSYLFLTTVSSYRKWMLNLKQGSFVYVAFLKVMTSTVSQKFSNYCVTLTKHDCIFLSNFSPPVQINYMYIAFPENLISGPLDNRQFLSTSPDDSLWTGEYRICNY